MHVVIDAHLAVKKIDGIARYLNCLLLELPKLDTSVQYTILSLSPEESSLPEAIFHNPNVRRVEINLMGPSPKQHLIMRGLIRNLKADIYHHPQYDLPVGIPVPSIITIHDLKYIFHPGFLRKQNWIKSSYIKNSLRYSIRAASKIIVVSQNTLNDLKRLNAFNLEKTSVIYHGVEPPRILAEKRINEIKRRLGIPDEFILFVGTRRPHKNIDGLIKALAVLRDRFGTDLNLVVAGKSYADYSLPEVLARKLGVEPYVRFLDFVQDRDLPALYQSAKVVALVSHYEGFGLPLVEAMSYGTPVIGSNVSSIPEVVGDAGLLADPDNVEDIAEKIHRIVSEPQLAENLSETGRARSRLFTWSSLARLTLDVYRQALGSTNV